MRRRLNVKLFVGLVVGSLLFVIGVVLLHGFQVNRNADGLRRRADAAREAGDLDEAVRLRRRFLMHRPDNAEQFKVIAIDAKTNLFNKAENRETPSKRDIDLTMYLMEEAVRKNGKDEELRREAADFWFVFKRYDYAMDNLKVFEANWTKEDHLRYIDCLRLTGGPDEHIAIDKLEKLLGFNEAAGEFVTSDAVYPELLDAYQSLVLLLVQAKNDRDMAEKAVNQMVSANKDDHKAYLSRARLLRFIFGQDGKERSYEDIRKANDLDPESVDTLLAMATMHIELEESDRAKELVEAGLEKAENLNDKSRLYNLLAQIYISDSDNESAMELLNRANAEVPADRELLWKKARILLDEERYAEVEQMYKPLERARTQPAMIAYLQARILMDQGDYLNGTKQLAKIRELVPKLLQYDIDIYLSMGYAVTKQHDLRLKTIERLLARNEENEAAQEGYVQTLMVLGRDRDAYQFLQNLIPKLRAEGKPVSNNLEMMRAQLSMKLNIGNAVGEVAAGDLKQIQDTITELYRNEDIPMAQRISLLIEYFRKMKDTDRAKNAIDKGLEHDPTQFALWALKIDYADTQEEAARYFQQMQDAVDPKYEVTMRSMLAKLALRFAPSTLDDVIKEQEQGIEKFTPEQQASLLFELGRLQIFQENRPEGIRLFEAALEKSPQRIEVLSALYQDASQQSDPARVNDMVNRIKAVTGANDDTWRLAEAGRIVWMVRNGHVAETDHNKALNQARQLLEMVRANRPEHLPVILLESELHRVAKDMAASIDALKRAHSLQPGNAKIIRSIAQAYKDAGEDALVDAWVKKLPLSARGDNDKRLELDALLQRRSRWKSQDLDTAIELVDDIVTNSSTRPADWILKSHIYLQAKQIDVAEQAAYRAKALGAKEVPEVWTNLISVLAAKHATRRPDGKMDLTAARQDPKVQELLREAESELPDDMKPLVLGRCLAILRIYDQAQAKFAAALQADPNNPTLKQLYAETLLAQEKTPEAAKLIEQLLKETDPAEYPSEISWARQSMAKLLGATSSYAGYKAAIELVEQNAVDGELLSKDLALWLTLCFNRPERSSWEQALIRLDQVEARRPLNDDELFMKAQLLERFGDDARWLVAKDITVDVLSRNEGNVRVVESYVRWLLKRGNLREAKRYATNNLAQSAVTRLRVELHSDAKEGRVRDAVRKIKQRAAPDPSSAQELSSLVVLASICEELGQYHKGFYELAESLLQRVVKKVPAEILRLATTMGLHGDTAKIQKALQYCMSAETQKVPTPASAGVALAILREHPDKWEGELRSAVTAVGKWLDKLAASDPQDLVLRWRVAEFHDMVGNLDRVETEYQQILSSASFNHPLERGMLLNNLAYAMALNGKSDKPLQLVAEAEKLLGPTSDVIDTRGYVHLVRRELDDAVSGFQEAIKIGPETAQKLFHLALAFHAKGNAKAAGETWKQALKVGLTKYKLPHALRREFDDLQVRYGGTPVAQLN